MKEQLKNSNKKTSPYMMMFLGIWICIILLICVFAIYIILNSKVATELLKSTLAVDALQPTQNTSPTQTIVSISPSPTTEEWVWRTMDLYGLVIQMPNDWTMIEMNRRPEPPDPYDGTPGKMGHDCSDYQIISSDRMHFINITLPCQSGFDSEGNSPCKQDTVYIAALDDKNYFVRLPNEGSSGSGWFYEIASKGNFDAGNGEQNYILCAPITSGFTSIFYWQLGQHYWEMNEFDIEDKIALSFLQANK
jgi:hypothetical protein